jgi:RNA polymerase sigma factor (sigma-70 family)
LPRSESGEAGVRLGGEYVEIEKLREEFRQRGSGLTSLVVRLLQGTSREQEEALYAIQRALRGAVRSVLRKHWFRDDRSIDDVWVRVLVRVQKRADRFDPKLSAFATWVINQAKFAALDYRREQAGEWRQERRSLELPRQRPHEWDDEYEPLGDDEKTCLRRAKGKLSGTQRRLLEMRYEEGLSYDEIRERTGITTSTDNLRVNTHRATKKLRELYEAELGRHNR